MKIPLVDLSRSSKLLEVQINKKLSKIIRNGDFILGDEVTKFEDEFSDYTDSKHCIGIASGTDGILLSLMALGIGRGDEVIVPSFTFSATLSPILLLGAKPVLVDVLPDIPLIDSNKIKRVITSRTKAIIPVHMYGFTCDMEHISKIARESNIAIVEDACQAHGSLYKNKHVGSYGIAGIFSFYPGKNLGAYGDAGAIITNYAKFAKKIYALRNHGQEAKYLHKYIGINSRLDSVQAAVLSVKLKHLNSWNNKRSKVAKKYKRDLRSLEFEFISTPKNCTPNHHLFVVRHNRRDKLINYLKRKNIFCGIHYPLPLHLNPAFKNLGVQGEFPNSEIFSAQCMSLPIYPEISRDEIQYVIDSIKSFFDKET